MTDSLQSEIAQLREEVHASRMTQMREAHAMDLRLHQLDNDLRELTRWQGERWRSQMERESALAARLKVFEAHKSNVAWLGWSIAGALALGALKLWLPVLGALF